MIPLSQTMISSKMVVSLSRHFTSQTKPPVRIPTNPWKRKQHAQEESYFQELQRKIKEKKKELESDTPDGDPKKQKD